MNTTDQATTNPSPRPLRFSILALLGLMTVCALFVALFAMIGERAKWKAQTVTLREELRQLRQANQLLNVVDPRKIYVCAMVSPFERMGRWRVHLPEGRDYRVKYDWKDLPPDRDPTNKYHPVSGIKLPPGTYTISQTFQFTPSQNKSQWRICITASKPGHGGRIRHGLPVNAPSWLVANNVGRNQFELPPLSEGETPQRISFRTSGPVLNTPQSEFDFDEQVSLVTYEAYDPSSPSQTSGKLLPQEVFHLWIEKEPQQP
ncbi:hypothetical protein [Bremerella alba]|uniref:Uncharacterized protein n=1 Tax=Bremerella alba TaxID=980252 RepID=A0A7V9A9M7_9BACT|nr:hypothetical protein [Bremerella alba]MBA2117632.1 hypothetical protein [Bremerella alba]